MSMLNVASLTKEFAQSLDDAREARRKYFAMLRKARNDLMSRTPDATQQDLEYWLRTTYGLKMMYDRYGNVTDEYQVLDEKKFLLFTLKFS